MLNGSEFLNVLYIGLGEMGYHIAGTLSKHFSVTVWNRTTQKAIDHSNQFGTKLLTGSNPFEHDISDIDFIMTCLPTSQEVSHFADLLIGSSCTLKSGAVWIDNTSGSPQASVNISERLKPLGVDFVDAPVSGGRKGARNATLTIMVGATNEVYQKCCGIFQAMGKNILHIDEKVGVGHAVKGANNLLYGCNLLLASKITQGLEKHGISPDKALKAMMTSSGGSNCMNRIHEYVTNEGVIDHSFKAKYLIKDMNIGLSIVDKKPEGDESADILSQIKEFYFKMALEKDWKETEVFDVYSYIQ